MIRLSPALLRTALAFVAVYGLAKGTSFVCALALPRLVDAQTYGILELALTIGAISASVLGLAAPAAAARVHLVEHDPQARKLLAGYCLWLATIGLTGAVATAAVGGDADYMLYAAVLGVYALQTSTSSYTRMHGLIHLSGWFDNLAILLTAATAVALVAFGVATATAFAWTFVAIGAASAAASAMMLSGTPFRELMALARRVFRVGGPMMLYSLAMMTIFTTPRVVIANATTIADVASFSLCSRLALVLILVHQLLSTGFFRHLYQMEKHIVGRVLVVWIVALSGIALILAVIGRYAAEWVVIGTQVPVAAIIPIFPAIIVQTVLWVLNANLEIFVNRELISRRAAILMTVLIVIAMGVGWLLDVSGHLSLLTIIYVYAGLMLACVLTQMLLLSREGFSFKACYLVLPTAAAPLLVLLLPQPG